MSLRTRSIRLVALLTACAMLALSVGFAWAVVDDYDNRDIIPDGVSLNGTDMSGMSIDQARDLIEREVATPMLQPLEVTFQDRTFPLDPKNSLAIDVDAMIAQAIAPNETETMAERSIRRITASRVSVEIEPVLDVDSASLDTWIADVASQVDSASVDATVTLQDGAVVIRPSAVGYRTDTAAAQQTIKQALLDGEKDIELPVGTIQPQMTEADLGTWIRVDISERTAYLYNGVEMVKKYGIAVGMPGHSTPRGDWKITAKRYMPTWYNPGSAWATSMPAYIAPGPGNPLGTRAINISASGIRFHGTSQDWSIGRAASHGCMRMHRWDVEDLYERVEVGNRVLIVD